MAEIQLRVDELLSGDAEPVPDEQGYRELFAEFSTEHAQRAAGLASLCEATAEKIGGVSGLEAAMNTLYEYLPSSPLGMVEHATKLFLTHYSFARKNLLIRSLEERQPGMVAPAGNILRTFTDRGIFHKIDVKKTESEPQS